MKALSVYNLLKRYPSFTLDGVSFAVEEGRIVGLIGANGAGKTTTLKGIMGLIAAEGEVKVFGEEGSTSKEQIGYVGGGFHYYPQKSVACIARAVAPFYRNWSEERFQSYLMRYAIDPKKKVAALSEGMKVKFFLALALSHGARLLILDEPTSGLDPLSREDFCETLSALVREEGVSVLFSTHITTDLERIADGCVFLSEGRVLFEESMKSLANKYFYAAFESEEEAVNAGAIGVRRKKEGFEGLLTGGGERKATLDEIMIGLVTEQKKRTPFKGVAMAEQAGPKKEEA